MITGAIAECLLDVYLPDNFELNVAWSSSYSGNLTITPQQLLQAEIGTRIKIDGVVYTDLNDPRYPNFPRAVFKQGQLSSFSWNVTTPSLSFSVLISGSSVNFQLTKKNHTCSYAIDMVIINEEDCGAAVDTLNTGVGGKPHLDFARSGFMSRDTLTLVVINQLVTGRSQLKLQLSDTEEGIAHGCNQFIRKVANCTESYTFTMPFADVVRYCLPNNSVDTTSDIGYKQFRGHIRVTYYDDLPELSVRSIVRPLTSDLQWSVRFPIHALFLNLFSPNITFEHLPSNATQPFSMTHALVSQLITLQEPLQYTFGSVIIATLSKSPFKLSAEQVTNSNPNLVASISPLTGNPLYTNNCPIDSSSDCLEYWSLNISLASSSQCDMNDEYVVSFLIKCHTALCPTPAGSTIPISFNLLTSDFCPEVVESVPFSGTVKAYQDESHSVEKSVWDPLPGIFTWFEVVGNSQDATLVSVSLDEVSTIVNGKLGRYLLSFLCPQ